jgi:hypothetical protein
MPSPFPGMNPYLEQPAVWPDFHQAFCTHLRELLVPQVRPDFFVKLEEHVYIHDLAAEERTLLGRADVAVTSRGALTAHMADPVATLEAPLEVKVPPGTDMERVPYLEIRDLQDRSLVAVIELLSPVNKRTGTDREAFLFKRRQLFAGDVQCVEIDLLRGGPRLPMEDLPACDYYALVSRAERRPYAGLWPLRLPDRLPVIPVPLRAPRPDARVDLQAALHHVYDAAGYEDYIYTGQPHPRLPPDDEAWAAQVRAGSPPPV